MKKYLLRVACAAALTVLTVGSSVQAQGVFSPSVNGVRSIYQTRRAAANADQERAFFVITCSVDASAAAIANQIIGMGGVIRSLMGNQLVVDLPMSKLDEVAAIQGVLLIDIPARGSKKTDSARKASRVDEVHQGKADGHHICAIGVSTLRATESAVGTDGLLKEFDGWTNRFIFPPYDFGLADCLVANFYQPESTMLMATAAFGGYDLIMEAYQKALDNGYMFGCYGDAMLILDD